MRGTFCFGFGIALCLLQSELVNASVSSENTADAYDLDEIIVTASRRSEKVFAVPYTANVQDARELIENRQVRTLVDAMRELPGVMVQKTGHGQGSPYIRGFTGLRTLFLIDGIRLNNSTFREGPNQYWNTVDPFSVQRLEVVKGPSSVLHGSDAIGGTVNAITRELDDLDGKESRGRIVLRGASAEGSRSSCCSSGHRSRRRPARGA
jgi:hemoglobin/transferrin/lactoferrin receptor protein